MNKILNDHERDIFTSFRLADFFGVSAVYSTFTIVLDACKWNAEKYSDLISTLKCLAQCWRDQNKNPRLQYGPEYFKENEKRARLYDRMLVEAFMCWDLHV